MGKNTDGADYGLLQGVWLNKPDTCALRSDGALEIETHAQTDFWRETHYGFTHDNGHFLGIRTPPSFTCQLRIRGTFEALYDQAGLMIRASEHQWIKAGIELSDGHPTLSSVLTNGQSDWATSRYEADATDFWMRATLHDNVLRLQVSADGLCWPLVRLCPFPAASRYQVGPMACSPKRGGLKVVFSDWTLGEAIRKDLHDLS